MTASPGQLELSVLLDRLPEAVFTVDAAGRWTYVSRAFTTLTGIPAGAAVGEPAHALVPEGDLAAWTALVAGETETLRLVQRRTGPDGAVRWLEVRALARRDAEGRPAGATGILTDVTEQRLAERRARAEQAVTAMLVADHPAELAVQALLATLGEELEWDAGELWTQNASAADELRCTQAWARDGALPGSLDDIAAIAPGEGLPGRAWAEGVPVWAPAPVAGVAFPVASGGRPLAVIALYSRAPRPPEPGLDPVLARVGAHAGTFIDRKIAQRRTAEQADDLAVLGRVAHRLAEQTDGATARAAICEAARDVAGAACAVLFEPGASGNDLFVTAAVGAEVAGLAVSVADGASGTAAAYRTGHAQFVPRLASKSTIDQRLVQATGLRSAVWQPVIRSGEAVGVIAVGWTAEVADLPDRVPGMLQVLAADAAVAFERAQVLEQLTSMALSDELTGLPNRRAWQRELDRELSRARRYDSPLCLALLDLDRFKRFNDANGHQAGDELLELAAAAWRRGLRPTDLLARYGGEEFALLLPHTSIEDARRVVERLRAATPMDQTCSAGLVSWDRGEDAAALVRRADVALYDAKASGRDRTVTALPAAAYSAFPDE